MGGSLLKAEKFLPRSSYFKVPVLLYLQQVLKANIKFSKLTILAVVLIFGFSSSEIEASPQLSLTTDLQQSPHPDKPIEADVSFFIDDLSDIDLSTRSSKIVGQMVVEWWDPRLAFTPDPDHPNRPRDLNANSASELLKQIGQPVFEISVDCCRKVTQYFIEICPMLITPNSPISQPGCGSNMGQVSAKTYSTNGSLLGNNQLSNRQKFPESS